MMKVVVIFSVVMMTCSEVSSLVARCPDCEHLCSSRYSEECQYENYIDYCGCCEFCTGKLFHKIRATPNKNLAFCNYLAKKST